MLTVSTTDSPRLSDHSIKTSCPKPMDSNQKTSRPFLKTSRTLLHVYSLHHHFSRT